MESTAGAANKGYGSAPDALQETIRARVNVSRGIEKQISLLSKLDWRKRLLEFSCFASLGVVGVTLSVSGRNHGLWVLVAAGIARLHWR